MSQSCLCLCRFNCREFQEWQVIYGDILGSDLGLTTVCIDLDLQCTVCIKMVGEVWKLIIFTSMVKGLINTGRNERIILQICDTCLQMFLFFGLQRKDSLVPRFLLTHALHFFLYKGTPLSETADTSVWCYWKMGDQCWIAAGMPAEQKQLSRASQIAAHKTPSAPKSPLLLCYVTDRERRGEWDCACAQNLNTCCFVPRGKLTSACVLKAVMADCNCSNHFDTPCISGS